MVSRSVLVVALVGCVATVARARADTGPPLTVSAKLLATHFHPGEQFNAEVHITNTSAVTQHLTLMSCSWPDAWHTDDAAIERPGVACDKNVDRDVALPPGTTDTRILSLVPAATARGAHHFHLVFTPPGPHGSPLTSAAAFDITLTEVSTALRITGAPATPRGVSFTIANPGRAPIGIAPALTLEHLVNGMWEELGPLEVNACSATPSCRTLAPGKTLAPRGWTGYSCGQCICDAAALAPPGDYRVVAHSCAAGPDFVSATVSPGPIR